MLLPLSARMRSLDQLFDLFSKERRRYALYALDRADEPITIQELANRVREWETEEDTGSTSAFDDVVLTLQHTHLPNAASAEYIEYDRAENEIQISSTSTEFRIVLSVAEAIEATEHPVFDPEKTTPREFFASLTPTSTTSD